MKSRKVKIVPSNGHNKEYQVSGTVVVCKAGGWPGMRIHFDPPSGQGFTGESSEPLVTGEAYVCNAGRFESFWITMETVPTSPVDVELCVLDCAAPVINIAGNAGSKAWSMHRVAGGPVNDLIGTVSLYSDATLGNTASSSVDDLDRTSYWNRGYIGGGIYGETADTYIVRFFQHLNTIGTIKAELCRFEVGNTDGGGVGKSCSFEVGARNNNAATGTALRNGPTLIPWPAYGLTVTLEALASTLSNITWLLYERT